MDAILVLLIIAVAGAAGALEVAHLFELLTGALDAPPSPPASANDTVEVAGQSAVCRDGDAIATSRLAA